MQDMQQILARQERDRQQSLFYRNIVAGFAIVVALGVFAYWCGIGCPSIGATLFALPN